MIKYICRPVKSNKEFFQNTTTNLDKREFLKKDTCPSFYFRTGDICCPAPLINGKCVTKSNILNRINGLPICALNFEAANTFSKENKGSTIHLCTDFGAIVPPFKRQEIKMVCQKGTEKVGNKCYPVCPTGYESSGTKCVPISFDREDKGILPPCPKKKGEIVDNKCYVFCPFGFTPYKNNCIPNQLAKI
jgi:hypothetical protein